MYTELVPEEIGHKDSNPLSNSIDNLDSVSHSDNMNYLKGNRLNSSGYLGITIADDRKNKYRVTIGKESNPASFYRLEEAVAYRNMLEKKNNYHKNHGIQLKKEL